MEQTNQIKLFKAKYIDKLTKGYDLSFDKIFEEVCLYNDINDISTLKAESTKWFNLIHYQSFITDLLKEEFQEIIFHNFENVSIERNNEKSVIKLKHLTSEDFQLALEVLTLQNSKDWNNVNPYTSFSCHIENKLTRLTLIHYSITPNRSSKICIRHINSNIISIKKFFKNNDPPNLKSIILNKKNVLIAGSTGSGKTSFMRMLLEYTDYSEHIIVLEDTYEILPRSPFQTNLISENNNEKRSLASYCAYAMRMKPDRIIIGEMRSKEVVPFLLALNTGHQGILSSVHANSTSDALSKVALLYSLYQRDESLDYKLVLKLICQNIDYVVFLKNKNVLEVSKVLGSENEIAYLDPIYQSL